MNDNRLSVLKKIISVTLTVAMLLCVFPVAGYSAEDYDLPWLWPVPGSYQINSLDIYTDGTEHNNGQCLDIGANGYTGSNRLDVVSATSGTVFYICNKYNEDDNRGSGWGNYVIIQSGNVKIVYAHLQTVTCTYGKINAGDVIGKMGNTGNSTGVHLHLQAYPTGKTSTSTDIHVFDKYIDNPLYIPKFRFAKKLTESPLYGERIKNYYTSSSGSYYTYSGGLSTDYTLNYVDAKVRVIASSGAPLRSAPISENSYITDTAEKGKYLSIVGYAYDAYGTMWIKTSDGYWAEGDKVGFYDYNDSLSVTGVSSPSGTYGNLAEVEITASVKSGHPIENITLTLYSGENEVFTASESVDGLEAEAGTVLAEKLGTAVLADGEYRAVLTATVSSQYPGQTEYEKTEKLSEFSFTIDTDVTDSIKPTVEGIDILSVTDSEISVSAKAFDDRALTGVKIEYGTDSSNLTEAEMTLSEGAYTYTVPVSGDGTYILRVTATDASGNKTEEERQYIYTKSAGETWKVVYKSGMNIRSTPSTSGTLTGTASYGEKFVILGKETETISSTKYRIWGLLENGSYISLCYVNGTKTTTYLSYVSGYNNGVSLDLNGGAGNIPAYIGKMSGEDLTIPETIPTRDGAEFLGWATSSTAKAAEYTAGQVITEEKTLFLFAVWSDSVSPTISSVEATPNTYTNGNVTVKINATDNGDTLYYSFDGGNTWQISDFITIKKNTAFEKGSFVVRDGFGNITAYENGLDINFIDRTSPDTEKVTVSLSVSGKKATFDVSGATDTVSGIAKTEILLSSTPDFTVYKAYDITSEKTVTLADGVYYGKVRFTDGAGNTADRTFDRFAVGTVAKLTSPAGISAISTGSVYGDLVWGTVANADGYEIEVSSSDTFEDAVLLSSKTEAVTVTGLTAGVTYYVRIKAVSEDGIYPASDYGETYSFVTLSDDSVLYGFEKLTDAVISDTLHTCDYVAEYTAAYLDITAKTNSHATAEYYLSPSMTNPIASEGITAFAFTEQSTTVYIKITAENGSSTLYTLRIKRAGQTAETPTVTVTDSVTKSVYVGTESGGASLEASVKDGGTLSYKWVLSDGKTEKTVSEEKTATLGSLAAGSYTLYAVVTNSNPKCENKTAEYTSAAISFTVSKFTPFVNLSVEGFAYNGNAAEGKISGYIGNGETEIKFYSDSNCENEIASPSDSGTYYAKAFASETDSWLGGESSVVTFTISKAENNAKPEYTVTPPTPRVSTAYVEITSEGVEYSLNGGEYADYESGTFALGGHDTISFRFKADKNHTAGETVTVSGEDYAGITDIITNGSNSANRDGNYVYILEDVSVDVSYLKEGIAMSEYISFENINGEKMTDNDTVTTGTKIVLGDSEGVIVSVTVIVIGDVNCDGVSDTADAYIVLGYSNGTKKAEKEYEKLAADYNSDGKITSSDALLIAMRK